MAPPDKTTAPKAPRSPARGGRPPRDPAVVRGQLLDAATRRFSAAGFEGVNSNLIAR